MKIFYLSFASSLAINDACDLNRGTMVDDGSGPADGTTSSDTTGNLNNRNVMDGGSGGAEGTKSSWSADIDASVNPSSGFVVDGGSGTEGAIKSFSVVEVAGNLRCTNTETGECSFSFTPSPLKIEAWLAFFNLKTTRAPMSIIFLNTSLCRPPRSTTSMHPSTKSRGVSHSPSSSLQVPSPESP